MEMKPSSDLAKRIFDYLIDNPMSLKDFADRVGVGQSAIIKLLKGQDKTKAITVFKIENFLREVGKKKK